MDSMPSTPSTSRPASRAQSDVSFATATEHTPDSLQRPRTLTQEVDHIKSLISRSQIAPRQPEGIITAQIFRRRSNSTEPVPHTRILHELDSLKRRIRQEQTLIRRPSQIDPDTESEDDVLDEREEELDNIRRELANERSQREEWLASAETRVDILTSEKDGLMQRLGQTKDQLAEIRTEKEDLEHRTMHAETKAQGLQEQLEHIQNSSDAARREREDLEASYDEAQETLKLVRAENGGLGRELNSVRQSLKDAEGHIEGLKSEQDKSDSIAEDLKKEIAQLSRSKVDLEAALTERSEKISGLEENRQIAGEHLQRILSEHKSKNEESQLRIKELQDFHEKAQQDVEASQTKIRELEMNASDHDVRKRELVQQVDEHRKLLDNAKKDIDLHGKELTQLLKEHQTATEQAKTLTQQRDELKTRCDALAVEKDAAIQATEGDHQEALKTLSEGHTAQLEQLKDELDEAKRNHSSELERTRSAHREELDGLQTTATEERIAASDESEKSKTHITELSDKLARAEARNEELRQTIQSREEAHQSHVKKADESMTEIEQRMLSAEQRAEDANASLKSKELDLNNEISAKDNELSDVHGQLSELQQKLYDQSAELERKIAELSAAAEERTNLEESGQAHISALDGLRQNHASEMDELKSSHRSAISELDGKHREVETQLSELRQRHAFEVDGLRSDHESAISELDAKHEDVQRQLVDLRQSHASELELLRADHETTISELDAKQEDAQRELASLRQSHASKIEDLQSSHNSATSELDTRYEQARRQLSDLKTQHAAEIIAVKASYEESAGQSTSEHQTAIANLKQDLARVQEAMKTAGQNSEDQLTRLKVEHERHVHELVSGWSSKADEAERAHQADMQSAANEASAQLARAREESQKQIDERDADANARLYGAHEEHAAELAKIKETHHSQLNEAKFAIDEAERGIELIKTQGDQVASDLQSKTAEVERLQAEHRQALETAQDTLGNAKKDLQHEHEETLREALIKADRDNEERTKARMQVNYGKAYEENKRMFEVRVAEAEKASSERMATRDAQHRMALQDLASKHKEDQAQLILDYESSSKATLDRELSSAREKHNAEMDELRRSHDKSSKHMVNREVETAKQQHLAELEELRRAHEDSLKTAVTRELDAARTSHQAELDAVRRSYEHSSKTTVDQELESVRKSHQAELAAVHKGSEDAVVQIRAEADREMKRRLAKLEEEHENTLAAALANADEELDDRLRAQSKAHSKQFDRLQESLHGELESLQMQLEEATELRLMQAQKADADSQKTLAELGDKIKAAEQASAQLQARLDFELTGRAESERSLAEMRKQRFEEERKTFASTQMLQKQIDTLMAEKNALSKRTSAIFIPRDLESSVIEPDGSKDASEEVSKLKQRLTVAEQEREQAQIAGQQEADEKSELARQNDFLVKELEALMATRSAEAAAVKLRQDASAQTESVAELSEDNYSRTIREQKSDASLSAAAKQRQQSSRSVTPSTPKRNSVNGRSGRTWKVGSFEDYLQQAQAELSELGSVITANEALFAQKIHEHFGDLQRAKDLITAEYDEKFTALEAQRDKTEKDFSAKNAAEFAQERKQLVASYGADHDEPDKQAAAVTGLSSPKRRALKNAEERLVSEYNRRIVKRTSQIALQHAEDYQNLAQDLDRRLAELLGNRQKLESDLSVEPSKFEHDIGQYEAMSAQLETEKARSTPNSPQAQKFADVQSKKALPGGSTAIDYAPKSQLPKRTSSVTPRSTTSIPRAVPYPGNRESIDLVGTNQPHRPRRSVDELGSVSERRIADQRPSVRTRSPPSVTAPKHIASNPRGADKPPLQPVKSKFSAEPSESERRSLPKEPPKPSPHAFRPTRTKGRSLRHSSRVIVGDWQATNDI